ncbi:MAG TPA: ATP-binding protein [Thermoanaerobaculia bacterium]|jgi:PAS domain S-box-containing protein|nr:ATP-binding protein [Thermoanaerobaculia bacterium]
MIADASQDDEDQRLRSVAIQNAQSILLARQRSERDLVAAKEALELRTAELERANELIRTIAENAASCLLMLDDRGIATYMNPAALEETGYTLEEFARAPLHEILHAPIDRGGHSAQVCPIRNARERLVPLKKHRDVFVRKNGSTFPVSCSLSPLQRDGRAAGAVLEFRDITDEQVAQKTLEESSRRKDQFLATLSHELRTPMTAVLGWARMLKYGLSESESRDAIDAIEKSAEIQAQLIDDVLDVSRITAGRMTFVPSRVEVAPVLQAAMKTVHPAAAAKGIEILASVPPSLPAILGDEGRLQQIIWNLLANAVKFTPHDGTITVRVAHVGTVLRLTVQDNGKGIDAEYLPHVFEAFSQEDGTMTRAHEGIGLGLSIVRALVEMHGGRIRAASEGPGHGATFTVELPVMALAVDVNDPPKAKATIATHPSRTDLPTLHGVRVLVIDDQSSARNLVEAIFTRAHADVRAASSVREGLETFHEAPVDVIVCDLAMPEQDGFAFMRAIRALSEPLCKTPIIALTAFGRSEDRAHALGAGFDAYLQKPVEPEELVLMVRRLSAPLA